jgi:hypothetical protein
MCGDRKVGGGLMWLVIIPQNTISIPLIQNDKIQNDQNH